MSDKNIASFLHWFHRKPHSMLPLRRLERTASPFAAFRAPLISFVDLKSDYFYLALAKFQMEISSGCCIRNVFKFVCRYNWEFCLMFLEMNIINNPGNVIQLLSQCKCAFFYKEQQLLSDRFVFIRDISWTFYEE